MTGKLDVTGMTKICAVNLHVNVNCGLPLGYNLDNIIQNTSSSNIIILYFSLSSNYFSFECYEKR
jgi:hypothetical protein